MAQRSTQPLREVSTRYLPWGQRRPARRADNLDTFMCRLSEHRGSLNFLAASGPVRFLQEELYVYLFCKILAVPKVRHFSTAAVP
jgi:hypothetical protein